MKTVRAAVALALGLSAALPLAAQTVSPVIMEYRGGPAAGSFDLSNDTLLPLVVTIEPKSFSIDRSGNGAFRKLDAAIQVSFSETSLRLPPKSRRTVFYKATAAVYPAWFSVYANFRGLPRQDGMNVELQIPHTVYLLGSAKTSKAAKGDLMFDGLRVQDGVVKGSVRNGSAKMLRVDEMNASGAGWAKATVGGFPLLPGGVRDFEIRLEPKRAGKDEHGEPGVVMLAARFGGGSITMQATVSAKPTLLAGGE